MSVSGAAERIACPISQNPGIFAVGVVHHIAGESEAAVVAVSN